ncbi:MAG: acyltransferase family protein [Endomicrobium sp.]|jgi:peptidoglycan/LPS O-acetylase OafA/YrhL|nr:acyltransferase family protein [Endomicrobium sp.]
MLKSKSTLRSVGTENAAAGKLRMVGGGYFTSIDFVKVLACIFVIVYHALQEALQMQNIPFNNIFSLGRIGVSWFVLASGFALGLNKGDMSPLDFYKSRIVKVFPFYWASYIVVALFLFLSVARPLFSANLLDTLFTVFGFDGWSLDWRITHGTSYLVGEWYFGMLITLYLLFPFLKHAVHHSPKIILTVCICLFLAGVHFNIYFYEFLPCWNKWWGFTLTTHLWKFAFGIIIARNIQNKKFINWITGLSVLWLSLISWQVGLPWTQFTHVAWFIVIIYCYDNIIIVGEFVRGKVKMLAKYSFMAFLFQHQIIIYFLQKHKLSGTMHDTICYCIAIVALSFIAARLFYPLGLKIQTLLKYGE